MNNNPANISNKKVAYSGALVAVSAVFGDALVVMIYVLIRSSSTIYSIMPNGERVSILWANAVSAVYSIAIFSLLMAAFSSVVGVISAIILKKMLLYFNSEFNVKKAILISFMTALTFIITLYSMLFALLKDWMTFSYMEPFLFWFLLPAAIYLIACISGGSQLNKIFKIQST